MGGDRLEGHLGQHDEIIGCHRRRIVPDVFVQPGHVIQFVHLPLNAAKRRKGTVFFAAWESPGLAVKLSRCYFSSVSTITAKQLHQETKAVLNQLEAGESLLITRHGRPIGRIKPLAAGAPPDGKDIMAEVWGAQKEVITVERIPNPVLLARNRRRR